MFNTKFKTFLTILFIFVLVITPLVSANNYVFATDLDENILPSEISEDTYTEGEIPEGELTDEELYNLIMEQSEDAYQNMVEDDVFLLEDSNVTLDYIIDGNIFIICNGTVTISSEIGGNAFIIAKDVILEESGAIYSPAFIISEALSINGLISDLFSISSNLKISETGYIARNIYSASDAITVNGAIGRNANLSVQSLIIEKIASSEESEEESSPIIYGNLNYSSPYEISVSEGLIEGEIKYTQTINSTETITVPTTTKIVNILKSLISYLIFVLAIWGLFKITKPQYIKTAKNLLQTKPLLILGIGFLTLITVPVACIILMFSEFTIRISFVLMFTYIILLLSSSSVAIIALSEILCNKFNKVNKFLMLVISVVAISLLGHLPFIGGLISFASLIFGLGIIVLSLFDKTNPSTPEVKNEVETSIDNINPQDDTLNKDTTTIEENNNEINENNLE